jgi:hypothetical protein
VPRIVKEALVLLVRKRLGMQNKPEPLVGTLGRKATSSEEDLEMCFRRYIEFLVLRSGRVLVVKYYTSGLLAEAEVVFGPSHATKAKIGDVLELRILTPSFYSRLIQDRDILGGMIAELNEQKTIWINKPELLPELFASQRVVSKALGYADFAFTRLTEYLRHGAPNDLQPLPDQASSHPNSTLITHTRDEDLSMPSMEIYTMLYAEADIKRRYKWAVLRQLVAYRYLMGRVDLLDRVALFVRLGIAMACTSSFRQVAT